MKKEETGLSNNQKSLELYATSDGFIFKIKKYAIEHSKNLDDKDILTYKNMATQEGIEKAKKYLENSSITGLWLTNKNQLFTNEALSKSVDPESIFVDINTETLEPKDSYTEALELLEKTELKKENYEILKKLVSTFEIQTENNKADTLISALNDFKEQLKTNLK